MKVKEIKNVDGGHYAWAVKCPGCGDYHPFDDRWSFNGDMEKPTFRNSMMAKANTPDMIGYNPEYPSRICHSFVTDGRIQFLDDCTHDHVGQTMDLLEIDPLWNEEQS